MKKSMSGQGAAGALLLAGMMMSAGAMAASGDPVTGGSGTVTINVPIVTSTCSVAVPTEVNFDQSGRNTMVGGDIIINTKDMDITLSDCSGKTLEMSTRGHDVSTADGTKGYFSSGDPDHALGYKIYVPKTTEITGGAVSTGDSWIANLNNTSSLTIKPTSDNYRITSSIKLLSSGTNLTNLGTTVSGGFDYTFTYQ
ncbi:hypothetical protein CTP45_18835 [Salmonella enterica]|nr:hypothetical protein [Salmonella enterica]EDW0018582.1 hypothetical protein [Salmonella enterica subsp. enterica serovar Aba]EEJ5574874.1 hypothetical protein [Salmonella enterica subsp. enterica serovar Saintpaul]EHB3808472.1 hypothetical protein [Salmonella enterica subsp. enterica serovar Bonariensis]HCZ4731836.1 hypothetical protein [Salmonella enterica subsp. enterica serovar Saintpaul str. CFSAN004137]